MPEPNDSTLEALVEATPDQVVQAGQRDLVAFVAFALFVGMEQLIRVRAARRARRDRGPWARLRANLTTRPE